MTPPTPRPQCSGNRKQGKRARIPGPPPPTHSAGELGPSGFLGTRDNVEWSSGQGLEAASRARARAEEAVQV